MISLVRLLETGFEKASKTHIIGLSTLELVSLASDPVIFVLVALLTCDFSVFSPFFEASILVALQLLFFSLLAAVSGFSEASSALLLVLSLAILSLSLSSFLSSKYSSGFL